jgi:hypothetical protein
VETALVENQGISRSNLFVKGKSGNPEGRPKGCLSLVGTLKRHFQLHPEDLQEIAENLKERAKSTNKRDLGALKAIDMVLDRLDGKPKQSFEMSGKDGNPIETKLLIELVRAKESIQI